MLQPPSLPPIWLLFSPSNLITSNFYFLIFFHLQRTCIEWLLMFPTSSFPIPLLKCLRNTNDSLKQTKKVWLQAQIEKWHCMHMTHLINCTKSCINVIFLLMVGAPNSIPNKNWYKYKESVKSTKSFSVLL